MIDNFERIRPLLSFDEGKGFYFIQVLQRNKENPELGSNNNLVKAYYIHSLEYLEKKKKEMIAIANACNARIYIHLSKRSYDKIALELIENIAHQINSGQSSTIYRSYDSTCGKHRSQDSKLWVVDVDGIPPLTLEYMITSIEPYGEKVIAKIPTKNGTHFITRPFNSKKFWEHFPDIEIHKNNPTVLYIP